jgi:hypothetical protein
VFDVERASDILEIIAIASKQGMKPNVFGGSQAWCVAKELARERVPVILNPLWNFATSSIVWERDWTMPRYCNARA